jgi:hypothetical protein
MDMPDRNLEQMMQPKLPVGVVICFSVNGRWPRPCSTTWDIDPKTNDVVLIKKTQFISLKFLFIERYLPSVLVGLHRRQSHASLSWHHVRVCAFPASGWNAELKIIICFLSYSRMEISNQEIWFIQNFITKRRVAGELLKKLQQ